MLNVLVSAILVLAMGCGEKDEGTSLDPVQEETSDSGPAPTPDVPPAADGSLQPDPGDGEPLPEGMGAPCTENTDCKSEYCVEGPKGSVCTIECVTDCPTGWICKGVTSLSGPDLLFLCVPVGADLCRPCTDNKACSGGVCAAVEGEGACTLQCATDAECPPGFACDEMEGLSGGQPFTACAPENGSCSCRTDNAGLQRSCTAANDLGECPGFETCEPAVGWLDCTAPEPIAELCNGVDDDCDGLLDEEVSETKPCENTVEGIGTCEGIAVCAGLLGWVCQAPVPAEESCDYADNDCDGDTDEDFREGEAYVHDEHCGACGKSCQDLIVNGIGECTLSAGVAKCGVKECFPGFSKANEIQCIPDVQTVCQPCEKDAQCFGGGICKTLDDGKYCTKPCGTSDDCPDGYDCAIGQCVPSTASCTCDGSNLALQRECTQTIGGTGGAPLVTCKGVETCTVAGWGSCKLADDVCDGLDNDCDGTVDEGYLAGGKYGLDEHCGKCGNNCTSIIATNASATCDASLPLPNCKMTCNTGTFDVNDNPGDGCECVYLTATDFPGGADTNCDGVDGELLNALFVAKTGNDTNPGTIEAPVETIGQALALAGAGGQRDVYVATGVYMESIVLAQGVAVYGGYSADFTAHDPQAYQTAIIGNPPSIAKPGAVTAIGISGQPAGSTRLDGVTIFGADNPTPGGNSYAIYLRNCDDSVTISGVTVVAGNGGDGTDGTPGTHGQPGKGGFDGSAAVDVGNPFCAAGDANAGGFGGVMVCSGLNTTGGDGGTALCPDYDDSGPQPKSDPITQSSSPFEHGQPGQLQSGDFGLGGGPGFDSALNFNPTECTICNPFSAENVSASLGQPGAHGIQGDSGAGGESCADGGSVVDGHWKGKLSAPGDAGFAGGGGGGGGAGGGVESVGCQSKPAKFSDVGGSGGGGGAGGCGGLGGGGATPGGGSFAVFLTFDAPPTGLPTIQSNLFERGTGGKGGHGGAAGVGGAGGSGGKGGPGGTLPAATSDNWCAQTGGGGGDGGHGGHGGGGAGGCGGASFGLYAFGAPAAMLSAAAYKATNVIAASGGAGLGGPGGPSVDNPGSAGKKGPEGQYNF